MNYTENYHLPQWDETDRILRKDFNQMCRSMEDGLIGNREEARSGLAGAKDVANVFNRRLARLMYNHYCAVKNMQPFPRQLGVFSQDPSKHTTLPNSMLRDGIAYLSNVDTYISEEEFFRSIVTTQDMEIVKGNLAACKPQILTFSTPTPGEFTLPQILIQHDNKSSTQPVMIQVLGELKNLGTGKVDWSKRLNIQLDAKNTAGAYDQDFNIPFHGSCDYQLILQPLNAPVNGKLGFQFTLYHTHVASYHNASAASFQQEYHNFEECAEGLFILRFRSGGPGGTVTFRWNGEVMQPAMIREVPQTEGWMTQEYLFYRKDVPRDNEFSVSFQCNKNGEFWFYDWGGIFC